MLGEIKLPPPATAVETVKNVKRCMAVCLFVCLSFCLFAHMSQHLTSSVSADGPRDAQYRSKSRQLLCCATSAGTSCTTNLQQFGVMEKSITLDRRVVNNVDVLLRRVVSRGCGRQARPSTSCVDMDDTKRRWRILENDSTPARILSA